MCRFGFGLMMADELILFVFGFCRLVLWVGVWLNLLCVLLC